MQSEFALRLVTGREVIADHWFFEGMGGIHSYWRAVDWLNSNRSLGGIHITTNFGDRKSSLEYIPKSSIESVVRL